MRSAISNAKSNWKSVERTRGPNFKYGLAGTMSYVELPKALVKLINAICAGAWNDTVVRMHASFLPRRISDTYLCKPTTCVYMHVQTLDVTHRSARSLVRSIKPCPSPVDSENRFSSARQPCVRKRNHHSQRARFYFTLLICPIIKAFPPIKA